MPAVRFQDRLLDVRPDRIDLRDREYLPRLKSLPGEFPSHEAFLKLLPKYRNLVLDQGSEGACTGFGLACVINYLLWSWSWRDAAISGQKLPAPGQVKGIETVSPRMLYHLARFYDEWPGEDYEGSSCRGAMKGWHRHGVCSDEKWPYRDAKGQIRFLEPADGWQQDAAGRPVGAYYRVNRESIADMQAAIFEVGAIYVSANVHKGWYPLPATTTTKTKKKAGTRAKTKTKAAAAEIPVIPYDDQPIGGHSFAIVGYTPQGFIVQNSWGTDWGYYGFGIVTYREWIKNGMDAWVAVLGAPVDTKQSHVSSAHATQGLLEAARARTRQLEPRRTGAGVADKSVPPWTRELALHHMVVVGNNGQPINRLMHVEDAAAAVQKTALELPRLWCQASEANRKLAIFAHGGLNSEDNATSRTEVMGPYFRANDIYPLFFAWQTGFLETARDIVADTVFGAEAAVVAGGLLDSLRRLSDRLVDVVGEAKDRTIELACQRAVKPIWTEMKQNAAAAARPNRGVSLVVQHLRQLKEAFPDLEIHLVGHSAGSILLGHFLDLCQPNSSALNVVTCSLFAPACTVRFATEHYGPAMENKVLSGSQLFFEILSDEREMADSVGPYGRSLLYLVSRALEDAHKTPLLGKQREWTAQGDLFEQEFSAEGAEEVVAWRELAVKEQLPALEVIADDGSVSDGVETIGATHGSFDNSVSTIERTIRRILGGELKTTVKNLRGF